MGLGLAVGYIGILLAAALAVPGSGIIGELIVQLPDGTLDWLHVPAFGLLAWLVIRGLQWRGWPLSYALGTGMFAAFVFGLWIEVCQGSVEGRTTSSEDLLIDAVGIATAGLLRAGWTVRSHTESGSLRSPLT